MTEVENHKALPKRRSALAHIIKYGQFGNIAFDRPGVYLTERHPLTILQLDTNKPKNAGVINSISKLLSIEFPIYPNTSVGGEGRRVIWSGPNRWLIIEPEASDLLTLIKSKLSSAEFALTDLSHGRTAIRLKGGKAREVLMKGSGVDWHSDSFTTNDCAHTKLFDLAATVDCRDIDVFDIYIARGFAEDFWNILLDATMEFGCRVD